MAAKIYRINYKSDFILTLHSDAGWMTPFCIKFWTGAPSQAFYAQWDGETYTHCSYDPSEPTKLVVQFDDHHLPIGDLKYQVAYHFTVEDFPNDTEDEVLNQADITTEIDGEEYQVMLDFTGETAPEIQFSLPAYANEVQRIANEQQRIANEEQRIANEQTRISNEENRINQEQTRQDNEAQRIRNEQTRINQEEARVREFATLKHDAQEATTAANDAAALANQKAQLAADKAQLAADKAALAQDASNLANQKAQLAADKAVLANDAAALANEKAALAQQKAEYANTQGTYAKNQGDYAKEQGDYAKRKGDDAAAQMQQQAQAFSEAQAARQTAYEQAEGTESGSVAGDGSRWGAFKTNEAARDAKVDAKVADITNLQDNVAFINKSFGKYDGEREITLQQAKSGKYVNVNGGEKSARGYGISTPVALNAGDILLVPSAQAVPADVSVIARLVDRTYQKVIAYIYTYRTDYPELPATAKADYDSTLVYTAVYDETGDTPVLTGWTRDGETYTTLPATREVNEQFYEPLMKQAVSAMPSTGYYIYLCPTAMTVVVSGLTATVDGGTAMVVGWGIFKNITTNFVGAPGQSVLAQAFAVLFAAIDGLKAQLENLGETKAVSIDFENSPKLCGQDMYLTGDGAPASPNVPTMVGQEYLDVTNKKCYKAFSVTGAISDWVLLN